MKQSAYFVALAVASIISVTAFADSTATYTGSSDNEAEVTDADNYSVVLISKMPDNGSQSSVLNEGNLVYADQAVGNFSAATMNFMIKENPSYGKYKVQLISSSGDTETTYFYIGIDAPVDPPGEENNFAMRRIGEEMIKEGYWNVGYVLETDFDTYNDSNSVRIAYDTQENDYPANSVYSDIVYGGYNKQAEKANSYLGDWPPVLTGTGNVKLVFQINYVPEVYKDSITAYLSKASVTNIRKAAQQ